MSKESDRADRARSRSRLPIHAAHGTELTARSWQTEAPLRMLMNNLDPENAERPEDLVVYGGTGKAARSWEAYDALVRTLTTLGDDETMLVQSGKPVGVMRTHAWAPRVLIANSNLVGDWANWEEFRRLEDLGLTMYGQMTAGSWIYIGTQGILQGTFETFAAWPTRGSAGTLAGTITLTAGLGGMGGAQPLAVTMNDGVAICVDVDQARITRRIEHRYLDEQADSLEDAVARRWLRATSAGRCRSALLGNAAEIFPRLLEMDAPIDIVTDQTSAHDPLATCPRRLGRGLARRCRPRPRRVHQGRAGVDGRARAGDGGVPGQGRRGLRLRQLHPRRGPQGRLRPGLRVPGLRAGVHPAAVLRGQGPVPLGRAVRRPGRHRRHRPGDPRALPRQRSGCTSGSPWPGARALPGTAGPHLLAGLRRAPPGRPEVQRDGRLRRAEGTARDRPRPPRLRVGGLAVPRDRGDARRLRRDRRLGASSTPWSTRHPAPPGCRSTTAAASAWAARCTPVRSASPTAPTSPPRRSSGCSPTTRAWA